MRVATFAQMLSASAVGVLLSTISPGMAQDAPRGAIQDRWPDALLPDRTPAAPAPDKPIASSPEKRAPLAEETRAPAAEAENAAPRAVPSRRAMKQARRVQPKTQAKAQAKAQAKTVRRTAAVKRRVPRATPAVARSRSPVPQPSMPRVLALKPADREIIYRAVAAVDPTLAYASAQPAPVQYLEQTSQTGYPVVSPVVPSGAIDRVGTILAPNVRVTGLPVGVAGRMPALRQYGYTVLDGRLLIVDPATGTVVADASR